jgi:hypothetical protein
MDLSLVECMHKIKKSIEKTMIIVLQFLYYFF